MLYCGYTIFCIIFLFGKSSHIILQISHIRLSFRMVDCEIAGASSSSLASLVIWIPFLMQLSCVNLEAWSVSDPTISTKGKNDGMYAQFNTSKLKVTIKKRKFEYKVGPASGHSVLCNFSFAIFLPAQASSRI